MSNVIVVQVAGTGQSSQPRTPPNVPPPPQVTPPKVPGAPQAPPVNPQVQPPPQVTPPPVAPPGGGTPPVTPPPPSGGEAAGAAGGAVAAVVVALMAFRIGLMTAANVLDIFTLRTRMNADKMVAIAENQELLAQVINKRKNYETVAMGVETASGLLGPAGKFFVGDPAAKLTRSIGDNVTAAVEAFLKTDKAYRDRFEQIAKYSTRLAGERGTSISAKVVRDVAEAEVLGDRLGNLARQQRQLDTVQQQIDTLKKFIQLQEQSNETQTKIKELNEQLNKQLEGQPKKIADQIRKMARDKDTPLTKLLDNAPRLPDFPPHHGDPRSAADRGRLTVPIITGGF